MIRVAVLSFWHVHAWDYTNQALAHPGVEVVAAWDEDPERGTVEAARIGVDFHADLDELLARDDVDAVIVDAPTNIHRDVIVKSAAAGKHIFTEKVVTATATELDEVLAAVRDAGVVLTVSLPFLYRSHTTTLEQVVDGGSLGDLVRVRVLLSHDGAIRDWLPAHFYAPEQTLGGALIDLGCHPMYLTRHFLGRPDTVTASYGFVTGKEVEDNAVAILRYGSGALGVVEAGFVTATAPFTIELHGTLGSAIYDGGADEVRTKARGDESWTVVAPAADAPTPFDQFVAHVNEGTTADANVALAAELTELMDAANRSAALDGAPVSLADLR